MMLSKGEVKVKMDLNKDMFYPREVVKVEVGIDNSKGERAFGKCKCKLLRVIDVYRPNTAKVM